MKADAETIHRGVTALSYARSEIHMMCNRIEQALDEASGMNKNGKFKQCSAKINEIVVKIRRSADDLAQVGQTLQRVEEITREFGE